ncbi:MAG TPA: diacylglycerol kinase family protein [Nakamurella sp.]|nr:diacylglycerol kinase family protein [Nakamurella sp.]
MTSPPGRRRPRIALVINPAAGRGAGARAGQRAAAVLRDGAELTVLQPAGGAAGSLAALVAVLRDRPDAVLVCGGDGMAHLAVNALAGGEVPLGVIPCGTGNDAAEVLGMHRDPAVAAGQLLRAWAAGSVRRIDVGRCDGPALLPGTTRAFLGLLYAGFDSAVNDRANRMRHPRGPARYTIALAVEAIRLQARPFRFCLDDVETRVPATLVAVGNGPQYGGGKLIAPQARWDDGVLGVTVVGPVSRMTLARLAPTLPHAGHVGHPCVRLHSAHRVLLDAADTMAYADGEPVGPLPVRVWADPGALPVLVPVPG